MSRSTVSPSNGFAPATHSYRMTPSAHTSACGPTNFARPTACSGAMYAGVPMNACDCVRSVVPRFASPKSATFGSPSAVRSTFAGFRSRWTMPSACAAATPRAIFSTSTAASRSGMGPPTSRRSSEPPDRYSIAMNGPPACSPNSYTCTTCGCFTAAITSASAQNRDTITGRASVARSVFSATSRFNLRSRARNTSPMPPRPSRSMTS